jgi:hypothetical protein
MGVRKLLLKVASFLTNLTSQQIYFGMAYQILAHVDLLFNAWGERPSEEAIKLTTMSCNGVWALSLCIDCVRTS